jgi:hypothetical protein
MTDAERIEYFANELEWVAKRLREGRAGDSEIDSLVTVMTLIRNTTPPPGAEEEINARYKAAKKEETLAAADVAAFYWPLVKEAKTEAEARAILLRVPDCVEKAFFMDHFVYVSKVIPKAN